MATVGCNTPAIVRADHKEPGLCLVDNHGSEKAGEAGQRLVEASVRFGVPETGQVAIGEINGLTEW